ncbi:putative quinol monooxygenase [Photobacterium sp. TY1-4]|uniref:putative quinol monooxygenase n=1 Tax=Photobacterium sp. TY1-4 TaxID=2899122 RepID=UPI0021C1C0DD|nr:antibiotic biosynthesis monooxygenase [Photobacterium sp. TY1-4]UXI02598.1 antibiotic biosynthesis monooxygenase [Photobacterium sp. TY1-4]
MSVRVTLNCPVKPERFQQLLPFLKENLPNVRSFNGNLQVKVLFDQTSNEMLLDEEWLSVESHQAYLSFIHDNGVLDQLGTFLSTQPTIKYFETIEI